ncbi:MAG: ATP-binding protein [Alphaproteobacteria bacterium]|nr:ATP-binding protein [Alphaproteobacteria bacterium]
MDVMELPTEGLSTRAAGLVGFEARYTLVAGHLRLILERDEVRRWSQHLYGRVIGACTWSEDRHPLAVFSGDVGTGKTVTAECVANRLSLDTGREGRLLKVSADIRGSGLHGDMSRQIGKAFADLTEQAGKKRLAFLLIDEADAIATQRSTEQMHQEEKAGVNFLIQGLDGIRRSSGRAIAMLCTNRLDVLDAAIVRRAACVLEFQRPSMEEAVQLLRLDLDGTDITDEQIRLLAERTTSESQNGGVGYTFSDYRQRLFPCAVAMAYPNSKLTWNILSDAIEITKATPEVT